jgi:hypothetical protein
VSGGRRIRTGLASIAAVAALGGATAANASAVSLELDVSFKDPSVVGISGEVGTITLTGSDFGDPLVISNGTLRLTPACAQISDPCFAPEPGVFSLGSAGTGAIGTDCQGQSFSIAVTDPGTGEVTFTSDEPLTLHDSAPGGGTCKINFLYSTLSLPTLDPDVLPGAQTYQWVSAIASGVVLLRADAVSEVTIAPAPAPPAAQPAAASEQRKKKCKKRKKRKCKKRN